MVAAVAAHTMTRRIRSLFMSDLNKISLKVQNNVTHRMATKRVVMMFGVMERLA